MFWFFEISVLSKKRPPNSWKPRGISRDLNKSNRSVEEILISVCRRIRVPFGSISTLDIWSSRSTINPSDSGTTNLRTPVADTRSRTPGDCAEQNQRFQTNHRCRIFMANALGSPLYEWVRVIAKPAEDQPIAKR